MNDKNQIRQEHKELLGEIIKRGSLDSLPENKALETLLFFAIPNGKAKELADRLIEHFGGVKSVMLADTPELMKVEGVDGRAAGVISFMRQLSGRCSKTPNAVGTRLTYEELAKYYRRFYFGLEKRQVFAAALDDELNDVGELMIYSGEFGDGKLDIGRLAEFAKSMDCSRVAIAHNHLNGKAEPSWSDIAFTKGVSVGLKEKGVELYDHVIIGGFDAYSLHESIHAPGIWEEILEAIENGTYETNGEK